MTALTPERRTVQARPRAVPPVDATLAAVCRERAAALSHRIAFRVHSEVAAFATTSDSRVEGRITQMVGVAVAAFMDALTTGTGALETVYGVYRRLGTAQARAGHDLDAVQAAHQIVTQEIWDELSQLTTELDLATGVVVQVADAVMAYQRQLLEQTTVGFAAVRERTEPAEQAGRHRLASALLGDDLAPEDVARIAAAADWTVPALTAVLAVPGGSVAEVRPELREHPGALVSLHRRHLVLVVDDDAAEVLAQHLAHRLDRPVALTWGVPPAEAHHAARWATIALSLAARHLVPVGDDGVVRCRDHQAQLCLHADPTLRRHADADLLAPLLAERPAQRLALAETMLLWLRTRGSAPALAARLGVHDQTVRHRLRRLKKLFGERLTDPAHAVGLLTALESATPRWREPD